MKERRSLKGEIALQIAVLILFYYPYLFPLFTISDFIYELVLQRTISCKHTKCI